MTDRTIEHSFSATILIVDDNPQNLQVLAKILQDNNFEIEFATSGEVALEWLKTTQFGLVLLDVNMPGMNGFEVCQKIRSDSCLNNIPVIFLSADSDRESILKGFGFGAQDYITKPFDSRELLVRVRTHLKLKDSLEKLDILNRSLEEKVTERTQQLKDSNENLNATNLKLLDLDRLKTEFLRLISHEIRTPLNGIIGPLELLKGPNHETDHIELLNILDTSVKRLERFASNALMITQFKTKQYKIKMERLHLKKMINELLIGEKARFNLKNIQVQLIDEITDGFIMGEVELIKKCVDIILDNALHFSPLGGTIRIRNFIEDQNIICEIKDTGIGFTKVVLENQFELFTTGGEGNDNRMGIGLPIAKMIMEAHGGRIAIENSPEGGAIVTLHFKISSENKIVTDNPIPQLV
jgi:two-component system sensor histidine kinase/response regulator